MASRGPTPMALAKQKYGPSVWRGMSAADKAAAIDAHQEDFRARVRSPGRSTAVRARSPLAVPSRSPPRTPGPPQRGGAAVAGSLSDMNALLGTLQATNALSDGHAAQLGALQEAVVSSMLVVEQEMDKLHKQTEAQLVRFSADKATLLAEKEQAVAAQLAAEEEARVLRVALDEVAAAGAGGGAAGMSSVNPEALAKARAGEAQAHSQLEQTVAALAQAQAGERQLRERVALVQQELDAAKGQSASLSAQLEAEVAITQQLRADIGATKSENEAMRLNFAARLEEMTREQNRLREQQDELSRMAREG
jgi:hypothetical protein